MEELENVEPFDFKSIEQALQNPASKNFILNLLNANKKSVFELFNTKSPVKKITKKVRCESPTALLRRRELEKQCRPDSPLSEASDKSSKSGSSSVPFESIFKNVVAYVEVLSNGEDRSAGPKSLLKLMGATVREKFSSDVTHVIYKDGSYLTYQRAKFQKVHIVSVLWLEACRRNGVREAEKDYPALGTENSDNNVSLICSQMQKEYEEVIRSEIRKTLDSGNSLPSTKFLMETRSSSLGNNEVDNILCKIRGQSQSQVLNLELGNVSPIVQSDVEEVTSDSDDYRSLISRRRITRRNSSFMDLTNIPGNSGNKIQVNSRHTIFESPKTLEKRKINENSDSDDEFYALRTPKRIFNKPLTPPLKENVQENTKNNLEKSKELIIDESTTDISKSTTSTMPSLRLSSENKNNEISSHTKSSASNMSSLRLSNSNQEENTRKTSINQSKNINISSNFSLRLSSDKSKNSDSNMSSLRLSSSVEKSKENDEKQSTSSSYVTANEENESADENKRRPRRKSLFPPENTPKISDKKSDIKNINSPFVNTRPRRVLKSIDENKKIDTIDNTKSKRRSTRLLSRQEKDEIEKKELENSSKKQQKITQPNPIVKLIRSKSETQIDTKNIMTTRRRKLFNPDEPIEFVEKSSIRNDEEEREKIRKEKILSQKSPVGIIKNCNVLLTQKAAKCLEKTDENQLKNVFLTPKTPKKKYKRDTSMVYKSSDRQTELIDEFVNKKKSKKDEQTTPSTRKLTQKALTDVKKRRSTLDFQINSQTFRTIRPKLQFNEKPTIVCTKMHKADVQIFNQIVKKLGHFHIEDEVSRKTTHLVVGEVKRTINMLRAIARGCWIVSQDWLLSSLENQKWLPEEKYEVTEFSPAVKKCRLERMVLGPTYTMNIFLNLGKIFVALSTTPRCSDLRELIVLCEGKITKNPDLADIAIGIYIEGKKCVNELWVLDSITYGRLKSFNKYIIKKK